MRSSALIRSSRSLLKASSVLVTLPATTYPRVSHAIKRQPTRPAQPPTTHRGSRLASSSSSSALESTPGPGEDPSNPNESPGSPLEEPEKPKQRRTRVSTTVKEPEPVKLPEELDILWSPDAESSQSTDLPPPEIFKEVLHNLHITLHPQTQHRATYITPAGPPVEPTLALYCPIEGGEYIIDATVRELARRTGSEVVVLDAVQLAGGEWGQFGKAAASLQLPRNPLHFPSSSPNTTPPSNAFEMEDEDDDDDMQSSFPPHQMTVTLMAPSMSGRALIAAPTRRNSPPNKAKAFFDAVVNISGKEPASPSARRPRLIYIRDFPTLASTAPSWYPPLLSAVRGRRKGSVSRPTTATSNPVTIIFGMTPSLVPTISGPASSGPVTGMLNMLLNRTAQTSSSSARPKTNKSDWSEGDRAEIAREKRLRDRLRKWEQGDAALHDELPELLMGRQEDEDDRGPKPVVLIGQSGFSSLLSSGRPGSSGDESSDSNNVPSFFRVSVLVPAIRSLVAEKACRVARRREINGLTMRMGIGAIGGELDKEEFIPEVPSLLDSTEAGSSIEEDALPESDHTRMWDDWGKRVEVWPNVRQIADRAVGSVVASECISPRPEKSTLDPTPIPWSAVYYAWAAHRSAHDLRKAWMKEASSYGQVSRDTDEPKDTDAEGVSQSKPDEVAERIKLEGNLNTHEERLIGCIVNSATMPTSFNQVHLPPHTIDSVRTIVSLPLLHPAAFQHGILKQHGMTGCLLFGPPGTGKTLIVRALAKEAGCTMLAISPSDVMDMYVGEGEKLVKAVFSLARRLSPCVVFLDEIDALFVSRTSAGRESGSAMAHRGVITQFMQEMDGLTTSKDDRVIVIGATNRPFDLDDAVLRRLPRRLLVDLPGQKEREEILKILLRDEILAPDLEIKALAKQTDTFSGSDLKHLCVSAALDAVKERVHVPWASGSTIPPAAEVSSAVVEPPTPVEIPTTDSLPIDESAPAPAPAPILNDTPIRILYLRNFTKALKEITPSSSETLGSLEGLRKWNEEFGEGRADKKKRQQVWGKGRFGFTDQAHKEGQDGRVASLAVPASSEPGDRM